MVGIDTHLKTIKEGVFGRDVRAAIHDSIEQVYADAAQNGNANMEVSKARGAFDNLGERLQDMEMLINGRDIDHRIQTAISNLENTSKGDTALFKHTNQHANLFNRLSVVSGGFYRSNGTFESNRQYGHVTIPVEPNAQYYISDEVWQIAFYRGDTYVSGEKRSFKNSFITIPSNANSVKIPILQTEAFYRTFTFVKSKHKIPLSENYYDTSSYVSVPGIPNLVSNGVIMSAGNDIIIEKTGSGWQLNLSAGGFFVKHRKDFHAIQTTILPLPNIGNNKGTWLYFDMFSNEILSIDSNENVYEYHIPLGVMFSYENPKTWHLFTTCELVVKGITWRQPSDLPKVGKRIGCFGDSITQGVGTSKQYHRYFKELLGYEEAVNYGLPSSSIARKSGTFPTWDNITPFVDRWQELDETLDEVLVYGGINDWTTDRPLGTFGDTQDTTFYGALDALCKNLRLKYPGKPIYFFTPAQRNTEKSRANGVSSGHLNRSGRSIEEYVEAMKKVAGKYGIPVCDLYHELWWALDQNFANEHLPDGLHPNEKGHVLLANKMANFIRSH